MIATAVSIPARTAAFPPQTAAPHRRSLFHQFLSELNPLQYLPVIGTIYRAVTGDTIPEAARLAGSLVVSGLTGGPIGIAMNLGATAVEHLLGMDPEKIGTRILADLGIGRHAAIVANPINEVTAAPPRNPVTVKSIKSMESAMLSRPGYGHEHAPAAPVQTDAKPWSLAQLTAYGIQRSAAGDITRGAMTGADVLNTLELARLGRLPGQAAWFQAA